MKQRALPDPAQELRRRAQAWAVKLRVNPRQIRVQDMRLKWGSCTSAGTITLSADLAGVAQAVSDYVMVHELLHLRYPRHSRVFTATLAAHVPSWRRLVRQLESSS